MAVPYYAVGTATLTAGSTAVVGQGTLWTGNVRPGDQIIGADGKTAIIAAVVDNTHLTLKRNWPGATQAAGIYEVLYTPDDPFTQQLARSVLQSISGSALVGLGGLVPAARKLPYFDATSVAALADLSDFARTLLDDADPDTALGTLGVSTVARPIVKAADIATMRTLLDAQRRSFFTSITTTDWNTIVSAGWFTTLLSPSSANAPPGTSGAYYYCLTCELNDGQLTQLAIPYSHDTSLDRGIFVRGRYVNVWSSWRKVYSSGNIVGAVSQSGTVPTGAIVERGTGANGRYTRFADGTQFCWYVGFGVTSPANTQQNVSWTYPAAFVSELPNTQVTLNSVSITNGYVVNGLRLTASLTSANLIYTPDATQQYSWNLFAAGRWF